MFKFLLGEQQQPMTIHTALVAEQSPALRALVSGFMEEAQTGTAIWKEVDEGTFARFAQFAYTGDYRLPSCVTIEDPWAVRDDDVGIGEDVAPSPLAEPKRDSNSEFGFDISRKPSKQDKKRRPRVVERVGFHDLVYKIPRSSTFADTCSIRPNESSAEDYTPVFLGHAKLYVFAEEWDIKPLKALVLHKLHVTLCEHRPYEARYGDIVELIRYTYEHTPCRRRMDPLRELVTHYVAHEQTQIAGSAPCLALVEDGGSFARDLVSMVLEKIRTTDD